MDVTDEKGGDSMSGGNERMPRVTRAIFTAAVVFAFLALGLAAITLRYKVTVLDGSALLLERWTGEATLVHKDGSFTRVEKGRLPGGRVSKGFRLRLPRLRPSETKTPDRVSEKSAGARKETAAAEAAPKRQGELEAKTLPGSGAKALPTLKWADGRLYCRVTLKPYAEGVKRMRSGGRAAFHVDLTDKDGFTVKSFRVPVSDMLLMAGEGDRTGGLEITLSGLLGRAEFLAIRGWTLRQDE